MLLDILQCSVRNIKLNFTILLCGFCAFGRFIFKIQTMSAGAQRTVYPTLSIKCQFFQLNSEESVREGTLKNNSISKWRPRLKT